MIHTLSNKLKERRSKLNTYLTNNKDSLEPEKHHQIKGALDELDFILNLLETQKKEEIKKENTPDDIFLSKPISDKPASLAEFVKGLF